MAEVRRRNYALGLHTVCKEAMCPNQAECAAMRTATFLILGDHCTRNCMFCAVSKGKPDTLNPEEPGLLAGIAEEMRLAHVVVTSVTRDDLSDGGAGVFAQVIKAIHRVGITVEALIPDFQGDDRALRVVLDAGPDVLNHNLETVPRLYRDLRPGASYRAVPKIVGACAQEQSSCPYQDRRYGRPRGNFGRNPLLIRAGGGNRLHSNGHRPVLAAQTSPYSGEKILYYGRIRRVGGKSPKNRHTQCVRRASCEKFV